MRRTAAITSIIALALAAPAAGQSPETSPGHQLINARCTRCHPSSRVLKADPEQLRVIVDRMAEKSPDLFQDVDRDALAAGIRSVLDDPAVVARRAAWDRTVAEGRKVFADPALGTTGKSCSSCHREEGLRGVADRYPEYDAALNRYVSLQERLQIMIKAKLGGKELPLGDPRTVALEAFLESLP